MCAGFLPHNFHQARLFMGDSVDAHRPGPLGQRGDAHRPVLGQPDQRGAAGSQASLLPTLLPLLLPISILIVPIADLALAVVRRTRAGRSPFAPDKQHLHHRLLEIGHSHRRAVLIMWMWAALVAFGSVGMSLYSDDPWMWMALAAGALTAVVMTFLLPKLHHPPVVLADEGQAPV